MLMASLSSEAMLLQVILQLIVIISAARIGGWIFHKLGQPQVVGEIATGLLLGPSCFGRLSPGFSAQLFPDETSDIFMTLGQLGLIFLMFIVGLEFDFGHLRGIGRTAGGVAMAGMALPFAMGAGLAYCVHSEVAAEYSRPGFVLFVATALSITAIPILGRIMMEFGITRTPLGVLTISAAAVDDAIGWILLATVSAAVHGSFSLVPVLQMLACTAAFIGTVFFLIRPVVCHWSHRVLTANDGALPLAPFSMMLLLVLASAAFTNWIGIFSIFGPFVLGASLCDQQSLQKAIRVRLEEFVTAFLLPVFFTYTGLRTNIGTLDSVYLWIVCGLVVTVAIAGKVIGCGTAARLGGLSWHDSASVAIMMNTRALMGLIAVNIGRDLGVIPDAVFCMMVVMAIVTTLITAPVLRRLLRLGNSKAVS
ncbi:High-affinity Na(+)/H(+) antiporter NhaS3 [Rubripirellula reticaptiva]|uniref:High-affinity Na(+)/H(+) antiporter NhaS3 n=2 Tax=Rubripirellula reticaptiva TaxID=2528013 RepID=A0A5C6EFY8_9BACT|nr:High-affinity Na(+)/H(+) antiporter NhaS3 [Rubripirellula reticaptiva]